MAAAEAGDFAGERGPRGQERVPGVREAEVAGHRGQGRGSQHGQDLRLPPGARRRRERRPRGALAPARGGRAAAAAAAPQRSPSPARPP